MKSTSSENYTNLGVQMAELTANFFFGNEDFNQRLLGLFSFFSTCGIVWEGPLKQNGS